MLSRPLLLVCNIFLFSRSTEASTSAVPLLDCTTAGGDASGTLELKGRIQALISFSETDSPRNPRRLPATPQSPCENSDVRSLFDSTAAALLQQTSDLLSKVSSAHFATGEFLPSPAQMIFWKACNSFAPPALAVPPAARRRTAEDRRWGRFWKHPRARACMGSSTRCG